MALAPVPVAGDPKLVANLVDSALRHKRIRHADGLGLAIVRAIADVHRATLTPRARPEGDLDIEVTFGDPG
ncbi:MAG TPA: hypothetical protein VGD71_35175 [Kribbella sp.]|jgi:hypothetical protein